MIASIAAWLVARNPKLTLELAQRLTKIGLVVLAALALAAGVTAWLQFHDKGVVEQHDVKRELGEAKTAIASQHRADEAAAPRDQARTEASQQTQHELETIHAQDPAAAAAPASRGTRAVAKRLPVQR